MESREAAASVKLVTSQRVVDALSTLLWDDWSKMEHVLSLLDEEPLEVFANMLRKIYFAKIPEAVRLATPFSPMFPAGEGAEGVELLKREHLLAVATVSDGQVAIELMNKKWQENWKVLAMTIYVPVSLRPLQQNS